MPPIGVIIEGVDFSSFKIVIQQAQGNIKEVAINYGIFINNMLTFWIISAAIFISVKVYNKVQDSIISEEAAPKPSPTPSKEEILLTEVRDLLKK